MTKLLALPLSALILLALCSSADTACAAGLTDALTGGKAKLDVRLRYEHVGQDNALDDADGLTLRTRLGYETGSFNNASAYVELENTSAVFVEDYNSGPGGNGKTGNSVIADPEGSEVNQAFLKFTGIPDSTLKAGRQRIILDKARFVGNVGWRQNEQTYDSVRLTSSIIPKTTLDYSYVRDVNNIFFGDLDSKSHLLNVAFTGLPFGKLTGYGYFIEFPDKKAASQKTYGVRFSGSSDISAVKLLYTAEYAKQSSYKDGNNDIDADYWFLEAGAGIKGVTGKVGYEVLGADDAFSFETPFATKHAYNGWADIFLNTPDNANSPRGQGLEDLYFLLTGKLAGIKLLAVYHDFQADRGSADFGSEIDLLAVKKFGKHYQVGVKYASYDANDFAVDTKKFWLWGGVKF